MLNDLLLFKISYFKAINLFCRNNYLKNIIETQVLIIGGGISGISIARELSKYKVQTIVVEKDLILLEVKQKVILG